MIFLNSTHPTIPPLISVGFQMIFPLFFHKMAKEPGHPRYPGSLLHCYTTAFWVLSALRSSSLDTIMAQAASPVILTVVRPMSKIRSIPATSSTMTRSFRILGPFSATTGPIKIQKARGSLFVFIRLTPSSSTGATRVHSAWPAFHLVFYSKRPIALFYSNFA